MASIRTRARAKSFAANQRLSEPDNPSSDFSFGSPPPGKKRPSKLNKAEVRESLKSSREEYFRLVVEHGREHVDTENAYAYLTAVLGDAIQLGLVDS